jgi:putative intracellular protease/amidase
MPKTGVSVARSRAWAASRKPSQAGVASRPAVSQRVRVVAGDREALRLGRMAVPGQVRGAVLARPAEQAAALGDAQGLTVGDVGAAQREGPRRGKRAAGIVRLGMMSLRPEMAGSAQIALDLEAIIRSAEVLRRPIQLADARLEDCDAVYFPGGHGPMEDLCLDADAGRLLTAALASGKPVAIVCHAPAALLATRIHGKSPFVGCRVTAFTNEEEEAVGLAQRARWTVESELIEMGVDFTKGEMWKPYTVVDRNLFTGQNPASASVLAERLLKVLRLLPPRLRQGWVWSGRWCGASRPIAVLAR